MSVARLSRLSIFNKIKTPSFYLKGLDPRITVVLILSLYLVLGFTVLGFNRTPLQAVVTIVTTCLLEFSFAFFFKKKIIFPFSALITSLSLSLLLNYSHNYWILVVPCFFAISSKYVLTFEGRHVFNPAQIAVSLSLLFVSSLITSSPAYQWNGIESMGIFVAGLGIFFLVPQVKKFPLVISFLFFFTLQILFRTWLMRHHLPFETLFFGTITSPAFFLFTFFMITDPATSPKKYSHQIILGFFLAFVDLAFHLKQSYHTFFYAGFTIQSLRLVYLHSKSMLKNRRFISYIYEKFILSQYWIKLFSVLTIGFLGTVVYSMVIQPNLDVSKIKTKFRLVDPSASHLTSKFGTVFERVDPRVQHIIKWLFSVGDSVAVGDYDKDGLQDIFLTNALKRDSERNALYKNLGNFTFKRIPLPVISDVTKNIKENGIPSNANFVDYDNDGDLDLYISYAFGAPQMLINQKSETGVANFLKKEIGLPKYTSSIAATFFDINSDGLLDLFIGNVWPENLPDYKDERRLNLFNLPKAEYKGDIRMFNFMHKSWHMSDNGGANRIFIQNKQHEFKEISSSVTGIKETLWSLAVVASDLNQDGKIDLYVANDFGPDRLYYNNGDLSFTSIKGKVFGDIGNDTYKGMNASIGDLDNNGWQDVYVSNVHHQLQAEGSLLWTFWENSENSERPFIKDKATTYNILNEERFGWGASIFDINNDGNLDVIQANGMVDDKIDKKYESCPDYWYTNEKIARSAPSIHKYIHNWGDIRGYCIFGNELNKAYLNNGKGSFVDVASYIGLTEKKNSRGVASADFNNDGKVDMIITNQLSEASLYENTTENDHHWIGFELESLKQNCNSQALGSLVEITFHDENAKKITRVKEVTNVNGFSAQNDIRVHFGLGESRDIIGVTVNWCQKELVNYKNLKINSYNKLTLK